MNTFTYPAQLVRLALSCQAHQDVRYYLNGIYLASNGDLVGTDGHRLARATSELKPEFSKIVRNRYGKDNPEDRGLIVKILGSIPKTAYKATFNFKSMKLELSKRLANGTIKTIKPLDIELIDGKYPDYSRVIPDPSSYAPQSSFSLNAFYLASVEVFSEHSDYGCITMHMTSDAQKTVIVPASTKQTRKVNGQEEQYTCWPQGCCMVIMGMRL